MPPERYVAALVIALLVSMAIAYAVLARASGHIVIV
jgi:hypothetical protein